MSRTPLQPAALVVLYVILLTLIVRWRWSVAPTTDDGLQPPPCTPEASAPLPQHVPRLLLDVGEVQLWAASAADLSASTRTPNVPSDWWLVAQARDRRLLHLELAELSRRTESSPLRLAVDVGCFTTAPSAKTWWSASPHTVVVSVEPNPVSFALLSAAKMSSLRSLHCADGSEECLTMSWQHVIDHSDKFIPIYAAVGIHGSNAALVSFRVGDANRSDVGSLLNFRRSYAQRTKFKMIGSRVLPLITLSQLLSSIDASLGQSRAAVHWDTLKIDAQGADHIIILSAFDDEGNRWASRPGADMLQEAYDRAARRETLLTRFGCIVGEFNSNAYKGSAAVRAGNRTNDIFSFSHRRALRLAGFAKVDRSVWINAYDAIVVEGRKSRAALVKYVKRHFCTAADERKRPMQAFLRALTGYLEALRKG